MSKKFKSQASSGRVVPGGFGAFAGPDSHSSTLSYIQEPPDYTTISDANVVVAFKNLSKKDSTTKAKALEDIQAYIALPEHEAPEEGLLEAWVRSLRSIWGTVDSDKIVIGQAIPSPFH